jgi:hypothetical protein
MKYRIYQKGTFSLDTGIIIEAENPNEAMRIAQENPNWGKMLEGTVKKMQHYGYNHPNFLGSLSNFPYVLEENEEDTKWMPYTKELDYSHWIRYPEEKIFQCAGCKEFSLMAYKVCPKCKRKMNEYWEEVSYEAVENNT